ncbi:MAG: hypothetical protein ACT4P7_20455 [Gemmatimonadaceae bacterium]
MSRTDPADKHKRKTPYRDRDLEGPDRERQEGQAPAQETDNPPGRGADRPDRPDRGDERSPREHKGREPR